MYTQTHTRILTRTHMTASAAPSGPACLTEGAEPHLRPSQPLVCSAPDLSLSHRCLWSLFSSRFPGCTLTPPSPRGSQDLGSETRTQPLCWLLCPPVISGTCGPGPGSLQPQPRQYIPHRPSPRPTPLPASRSLRVTQICFLLPHCHCLPHTPWSPHWPDSKLWSQSHQALERERAPSSII